MKNLIRIVLIVLISLPLVGQAQKDSRSTRKQRKAQVEQQGENRAEIQNNYNNSKKHHLGNQDKSTRKRMKRTNKKTKRLDKNRTAPWYQRWFRKRHFR
ncbi:MAG: hypothetical protein KDC12_04340 [Flavobacteriales bacterium]|nr:hypothetical protein [Flavobacteriales bacterium]